jgi:hypothetical protein
MPHLYHRGQSALASFEVEPASAPAPASSGGGHLVEEVLERGETVCSGEGRPGVRTAIGAGPRIPVRATARRSHVGVQLATRLVGVARAHVVRVERRLVVHGAVGLAGGELAALQRLHGLRTGESARVDPRIDRRVQRADELQASRHVRNDETADTDKGAVAGRRCGRQQARGAGGVRVREGDAVRLGLMGTKACGVKLLKLVGKAVGLAHPRRRRRCWTVGLGGISLHVAGMAGAGIAWREAAGIAPHRLDAPACVCGRGPRDVAAAAPEWDGGKGCGEQPRRAHGNRARNLTKPIGRQSPMDYATRTGGLRTARRG